jgi:two-component system chemotaxis response regulator CheB
MVAPKIVVVGTSWGGFAALSRIVEDLPPDFRLPIVVVQHRGRDSDETMASILQSRCRRPVREAEDKDPICAGTIYIAPPDYHLLVDDGFLALSTDEPVAFSRPSIDVLFESAADVYGAATVGVLLTGANQDGTRGLLRIKAVGGFVVVQDPETAEVRVMPENAINEVAVDVVAPLERIGAVLRDVAGASSGMKAAEKSAGAWS